MSQLYQLRGRVGRSDRPAYAYLLVPPQESLSPVARKRLAVIKEFSDLGSGFRVAALDLEIRGAGNLLGGEQSGHIDTVGFEMYMKLLEEAVRELKGEDIEDDVRATVNLRVDLTIDEAYVPEMNQRLMIYRKVAEARTERELESSLAGIRDRYGAPPESVLNLAEYGRIRVLADHLGVETIDREGRLVVIKFRPRAKVGPHSSHQGRARTSRGDARAARVAQARSRGERCPGLRGRVLGWNWKGQVAAGTQLVDIARHVGHGHDWLYQGGGPSEAGGQSPSARRHVFTARGAAACLGLTY